VRQAFAAEEALFSQDEPFPWDAGHQTATFGNAEIP